jgi:hypothetical protein
MVGLLARSSYSPASLTTYNTTTSLADIDATNMAVTFTAPPSGTVEVELDAMTSGGSVRHTWGLREGTADLVWQGISNDASVGRKVAKFVVSGMTPGSSHTFKWSQLGASTAAATYAGLTSSHYWPAHMRVYGVPVPTSDFDRVVTPLAGSISSQAWSLHVPIGPGPRGLVIWCHGRGGAATDYTGSIRAATATALLDAGYMVGGTAAHGDNFGNDASLADIKAFYDMVHAAYPVSDVIMWGESMGALDALLISAGVKSVPTVRGAMIFSGVCSLANAYAGIGDVGFTAQINTAFGITGSSPNTYAELTAGYDPALRTTSDYASKRFRFTGSASDSTATKASHMDVMTAAISGVTAECVSVTSTGGHSDASQYADTSAILAFVARCVAD